MLTKDTLYLLIDSLFFAFRKLQALANGEADLGPGFGAGMGATGTIKTHFKPGGAAKR